MNTSILQKSNSYKKEQKRRYFKNIDNFLGNSSRCKKICNMILKFEIKKLSAQQNTQKHGPHPHHHVPYSPLPRTAIIQQQCE